MNLQKTILQTLASIIVSLGVYGYLTFIVDEYFFKTGYLHGGVHLFILGVLTIAVYLIIEQLRKYYSSKEMISFSLKLIAAYVIMRVVVYFISFNLADSGVLDYRIRRHLQTLLSILLLPLIFVLLGQVFKKKKTKAGQILMLISSALVFIISTFVFFAFVFEFARGGYDASGLGLLVMLFVIMPLAFVGIIGGVIGMYSARN